MYRQKYIDSQFGGAKVQQKRKHSTIVGGTTAENAALAQYTAACHPLAGAFVDVLHLDGCRMNPKEIRNAVLLRLGFTIGKDNDCCPNCQQFDNTGHYESFETHVDTCRQTDCGVGSNFSANCHKELVCEVHRLLSWLPGATVMKGNIFITNYFDVRNRADLSETQRQTRDGQCSDLLVSIPGGDTMLIDLCVTTVLAKSNRQVCGGTGKCADFYEANNKDKKHAYFMDDEDLLTSMAFDSMGGFSENAVRVLRSIFSANSKIAWKDDQDRLWLQKRTVAVISAIIHKWGGIRRDRLVNSQRRNPFVAPA